MKSWIERALNVHPGDLGRGTLLCSSLFLIITAYKIGGVAAAALFLLRFQPINFRLSEEEVVNVLDDAQPSALTWTPRTKGRATGVKTSRCTTCPAASSARRWTEPAGGR